MLILIVVVLFLNSALANDYCKLCENGIHTMCLFKEGPGENCINYTKITLTPGEKRYILDIHNDIRNHVASGQESRGALGNQPAAADMFLLEWDEELAEIAQRWADQCISANATKQHDKCKRTERFDVGQNILTAVTNDGELPELSLLILNWYKQIVHVIPSDVDDFMGIWRGKYLIGQYTQLVWAKTKFVGCAVSVFKETVDDLQYNIRFVCNYGPAGNIIGQPIYEKGKACSRCPQKACDKLRPNLCSGSKKAADLEKQQNIYYKKYKDKATTMSNMIDIEDTTKNISKFLNPILLNSPETLQPLENVTNVPTINVSTETENNFNSPSQITITMLDTVEFGVFNSTETEIGFQNTSLAYNVTQLGDDKVNMKEYNDSQHFITDSPTETTKNVTLNSSSIDQVNEFINTTISTSILNESEKNLQNFTDLLFNTTTLRPVLTNLSKGGYLNIGSAYSITLLINDFFNRTAGSNSTKTASQETDDNPILDLTKNKCETRVKLDKGAFLVPNCNHEFQNTSTSRRRYNNHSRRRGDRIIVDGDNVILPGDRHFRKAKGRWHHGHCRCVRVGPKVDSSDCSGSINLHMIYSFSLVYSLVHFFIIQ